MNDRFFACPKCRKYTDAGYRWAYWTLEEPGCVTLRGGVNCRSVLSCNEYWNPSDDDRNDWLANSILPTVRKFIAEHESHGIVYTESDEIWSEESLLHNWIEIDDSSAEG